MLDFIAVGALLAAAPAAAEPAGKDEKVVCKRVIETGWRTARSTRVCRTQAEWSAEAREMRKELQEFNQGGRRGNIGG